MKDKLIFMHLPKCGGTTFNSILNRLYKPDEIFNIKAINPNTLNTEEFTSLSAEDKNKINLLKGHMRFGLHEHFNTSSEYITFLRDPIERIISYYYYVKRKPHHRLYQNNLFNDTMSLYEFVTEINQRDINNGQIGAISGIQDKGEFMLEKAFENIDTHFSFVGTIEKFDESLILLQKMYGWATPHYNVQNKTSNRLKIDALDAKTLDAIKHFNKGDIALYEKINKVLEGKINNQKNLKLDVLKLNAENYLRSKVNQLPNNYKKAVKRVLH